MQLSKLVATASELMRRAHGVPLASNRAQKLWLVQMGIIPLNANEGKRDRHADMRNAVRSLPINNPQECSAETMRPFVLCAAKRWYEYELLANVGDTEDSSDEDDE